MTPVSRSERIDSLDTLRGFALLGILLMNIVGFGLYHSAYDDPTVAGGSTGVNLATWVVMHILAEGKMRCLFSMVFGASVILLTSRAEHRVAGGLESGDIYYRRNLWLLLFGLAHAFLLWQGDILYQYAVCSLILFPFRKMRPRSLLVIAGAFMVLEAGAITGWGIGRRDSQRAWQEAIAAEKAGKQLTAEQKDAKKAWEDELKENKPSESDKDKDAKAWRQGNPLRVIAHRAGHVYPFHSNPYYHPLNWDVWSMMFAGMALFKMGVFSAARSYRFYGRLAALGYLIGISVNSYTAWIAVKNNFDLATYTFTMTTYDLGRLSIALAHMAVIMVICKAGRMRWLTSRFAAIGQTALSNYILQSVICAFVFTGYGLRLFGRLERYQLYYVVAACWVVSMVVSPMWLRRYQFGPLEWCWRSLTYWKRQPMRVRPYLVMPPPDPQTADAIGA